MAKCKQCGAVNEGVTLEPVWNKTPSPFAETPVLEPIYARWACRECGRYHFRDGSLYENPFKPGRAALTPEATS